MLYTIPGEKEKNAGYQHFLLFPQCFPKLSSVGSLKVGKVWLRVKPMPDSVSPNVAISKLHVLFGEEYLLIGQFNLYPRSDCSFCAV